jgi:sugar-specific transcriptional regulator TrmB
MKINEVFARLMQNRATAKKISEALNVPYGELFTIVEGG